MPSPRTIRLLCALALPSLLSAPAGTEDAGPTLDVEQAQYMNDITD